MKFGVLVFPGSNCDHDTHNVLGGVMGQPVTYLWHESTDLEGCDAVLVPGGFAYGDYLRTGAIARFAPIMQNVRRFAENGGLVMGICNGFQILCESGLLPGALLRNASLHFICRDVFLKVENDHSFFTKCYRKGEVVKVPIAHGEGNYFADSETLDRLEGEGRVAFRYADAAGNVGAETCPNGAQRNIAGITNETGRVLGMMPHPERLYESALGGTDGRRVFESILLSTLEAAA